MVCVQLSQLSPRMFANCHPFSQAVYSKKLMSTIQVWLQGQEAMLVYNPEGHICNIVYWTVVRFPLYYLCIQLYLWFFPCPWFFLFCSTFIDAMVWKSNWINFWFDFQQGEVCRVLGGSEYADNGYCNTYFHCLKATGQEFSYTGLGFTYLKFICQQYLSTSWCFRCL